MRISFSTALILGVFALSAIGAAQPGPPPRWRGGPPPPPPRPLPPLLDLAIKRAGEQRYTGTRVIEYKMGPNRGRHIENVIRDRQKLRLEFPTGSALSGEVIVEDGRERRHYKPDENAIYVMPVRGEEMIERLKMLAHSPWFEFRDAGEARVAGLKATHLQVVDGKGNVAQNLFIEPRTGLVLKREMFDRSGSPMGYFEFTAVNFKPRIDARDFVLQVRGARLIYPSDTLRTLARENGFSFVMLRSGSGYELEEARPIDIGGQPVLMQVYGGRGHRLTLYQTRFRIDSQRLRRMSGRDLKVYVWRRGEEHFALIGDLTEAQLQELAESLADGS